MKLGLALASSRNEKASQLVRQAGRCAYCQAPIDYISATWDHVWPQALGFGDRENLLLACSACNTWKSDMLPDRFFRMLAPDIAAPLLALRPPEPRWRWEPRYGANAQLAISLALLAPPSKVRLARGDGWADVRTRLCETMRETICGWPPFLGYVALDVLAPEPDRVDIDAILSLLDTASLIGRAAIANRRQVVVILKKEYRDGPPIAIEMAPLSPLNKFCSPPPMRATR